MIDAGAAVGRLSNNPGRSRISCSWADRALAQPTATRSPIPGSSAVRDLNPGTRECIYRSCVLRQTIPVGTSAASVWGKLPAWNRAGTVL